VLEYKHVDSSKELETGPAQSNTFVMVRKKCLPHRTSGCRKCEFITRIVTDCLSLRFNCAFAMVPVAMSKLHPNAAANAEMQGTNH